MFSFWIEALRAAWDIYQQAAFYILFGLLVGGMLKVFLSPAAIAAHLGTGRVSSVFKAALLGIPLPLCSCGVLPAAATLKKQGANNGAVTAFLISTPESGVDSLALTWALLDPLMTIARPLAAFLSAFVAGLAENLLNPPVSGGRPQPDLSCTVDGCCSGGACEPEVHWRHHSFPAKLKSGVRFAAGELWGDLVGWFFLGILLAGVITVLVPDAFITRYLGGGFSSMLLVLLLGIPLYICATASTPIAAALILKGVSPGTALVFLLAGPATNITSLSVLVGLLGKRASLLYLLSIAAVSVACGLLLDRVYLGLGLTAGAAIGQAGATLPAFVMIGSALVLLGLSLKPLYLIFRGWFNRSGGANDGAGGEGCGCGCGHSHETFPVAPFPCSLPGNPHSERCEPEQHEGCMDDDCTEPIDR